MAGMRSPLGLRLAAGAAAAVVVAGVSYEAVDHLGSSSPSTASGTSAQPQPNIGVEYGQPVGYRHHGQLSQVQPIQTGTNFVPAQLTAQVQQVLSERAARAPQFSHQKSAPKLSAASGGTGHAPSTARPSATTNGPATGIRKLPARPGHLAACIGRIAAGNLVVLVDVATYRSKPAIIIVTEVSRTAKSGVAWVVGLGCSAHGSDLIDRIPISL
jgi:hypothetical protein